MHVLLPSVGLAISALSVLVALRLNARPQRLVRCAIWIAGIPLACCAVGIGAAALIPGYICNADAEVCRGMVGPINVAPALAVLGFGGFLATCLAAFVALPLLVIAAATRWSKRAAEVGH